MPRRVRQWGEPTTRQLIRSALKKNPQASPQALAKQLETTPKYISRIARQMNLPKFKTGPKPRKENK